MATKRHYFVEVRDDLDAEWIILFSYVGKKDEAKARAKTLETKGYQVRVRFEDRNQGRVEDIGIA